MQTCMAEVSALHEVILDDGVVLLDKGCQSSSMAVRPQLLSSIQGMRVLQWQESARQEDAHMFAGLSMPCRGLIPHTVKKSISIECHKACLSLRVFFLWSI